MNTRLTWESFRLASSDCPLTRVFYVFLLFA